MIDSKYLLDYPSCQRLLLERLREPAPVIPGKAGGRDPESRSRKLDSRRSLS